MDFYLNIDLVNELSTIKVPFPLLELKKIPSQKEKLKKFLNEEEINEHYPMVFQAMNQSRRNGGHPPFSISIGHK